MMEERTYNNGAEHDLTDDERDAARIANREPSTQPIAVTEHVDAGAIDQKTHTLLIQSIDHLAQHFVEQQQVERSESSALEAMFLTHIAAARDAVTRMHMVCVQAQNNAERNRQVRDSIASELEKVLERQAP